MRSLVWRYAIATTILTATAAAGCTTGTTTGRGTSSPGYVHQEQQDPGGAHPQDPAAKAPDPGNGVSDGNGGSDGNVQKTPEPPQKKPGHGTGHIVLSSDSAEVSRNVSQVITLRNEGDGPAFILSMSYVDETDSNFTIGGSATTFCQHQHLAPGEECSIKVGWFGPSDDYVNIYNATLRIAWTYDDSSPAKLSNVYVTRFADGPPSGS